VCQFLGLHEKLVKDAWLAQLRRFRWDQSLGIYFYFKNIEEKSFEKNFPIRPIVHVSQPSVFLSPMLDYSFAAPYMQVARTLGAIKFQRNMVVAWLI
jgi:hypothetical protein